MNLVGHVAVALQTQERAGDVVLAGAVLPDVASIARVRLASPAPGTRAERDLAVGVASHHAGDAVFHASPWFHEHNRALRDALLDAGVDRGPARACAHAGLEMLLDGQLVTDETVLDATSAALGALTSGGRARDAAIALAAPEDRSRWADRLDRIGRSLDPGGYASVPGVAARLQRMTWGRARIEVRREHVQALVPALEGFRPIVTRDAVRVVDEVAAGASTAPASAQRVGAGGP